MSRCLLQQVQWLQGPEQPMQHQDVLIDQGRIAALGAEALQQGQALGLEPLVANHWLLAPSLVDPHSQLEDPSTGVAETRRSLERSALAAGYGTVALLPQARIWRDRPEALQPMAPADATCGLQWLLWGSLSVGGEGQELAGHADQLAAGAIGLAEPAQCPPLPLLERALSLAEMAGAPLLLAPRDASLSQRGFVRAGVEALRAGWPPEPAISETIPLQALLQLQRLHPERRLQLMTLSTAEGVELLASVPPAERPEATVCWWHLLADCGRLDPLAEGWRMQPPLGCPRDREALIAALASGVVQAVAVHHQALDPEEQLLPLDQRQPGVAGHRFVLPALWQELVVQRGWTATQLWQVLCFAPARMLGLPTPQLSLGSQRWILFDPQRTWLPQQDPWAPLAANQPLADQPCRGQVLAHGLSAELWRLLPPADPAAPAFPPC